MDIIPLLLGIPDDRQVSVTMRNGQLQYVFKGNARIATDLAAQARQRLFRVFFGPDIPIVMPPALHLRPHVNTIADADISAVALHMLVQHLEAYPAACFNPPSAVLGTTRDAVADKLSGIDGLHVPRTVRVRIDEPADLPRVAAARNLRWPLIVRIPGSHAGAATVRIDSPEHVREGLRGLAWGGRALYLTEYVDCRDADDHFRKMRLAVVGNEVFIRHLLIGNDWMVHAHDRQAGHLREEGKLLRTFRATLLPQLATRLRAIADAIGLDYFGIDCNLRPDGRLLIYEVNALMDILVNTSPLPNIWEEPIGQMKEALSALLLDSAHWRHSGHEVAVV